MANGLPHTLFRFLLSSHEPASITSPALFCPTNTPQVHASQAESDTTLSTDIHPGFLE